MSSETIVNRTPESFGLKLERERLEAETAKMVDEGSPAPQTQNAAVTVASIWNPGGTPVWNPGARIETAKVEYHVPTPLHVGETVVGIPQTAEAQRAPEVGKVEEPDLAPIRDSVAADILFAELVQRARGQAPRDPDLKEFRRQVIAAFKHLGLDTNKHFGV